MESRISKKAQSYMLMAVGIIIVFSFMFVSSYYHTKVIGCSLIDKYREYTSSTLLSLLYFSASYPGSVVYYNLPDYFEVSLTHSTISFIYKGSCTIQNPIYVIKHNLDNVVPSEYQGRVLCIENINGYVKLCDLYG